MSQELSQELSSGLPQGTLDGFVVPVLPERRHLGAPDRRAMPRFGEDRRLSDVSTLALDGIYEAETLESLESATVIPFPRPAPNYDESPVEAAPGLAAELARHRVGAEYFPAFTLPASEQLNHKRQTFITIFHASIPEARKANQIEVDQMEYLGDKRANSEKEFTRLDPYSFIIAVYDGQEMKGMIRITPYNKNPEIGNKTFVDIAEVSKNSDTMKTQTVPEVQDEFLDESGCEDETKIWDMTSLAVSQDAQDEKMAIINNLAIALNEVGFPAVARGELTHLVAAIHPKMLTYMKRFMGYPLQDLNGYGDVEWKIAGQDQAMVCHPAYFSTDALRQAIETSKPGSHLDRARHALPAAGL